MEEGKGGCDACLFQKREAPSREKRVLGKSPFFGGGRNCATHGDSRSDIVPSALPSMPPSPPVMDETNRSTPAVAPS